MEHDRYRRHLILTAIADTDGDEVRQSTVRVTEAQREQADREELEILCQRFDDLHNEARQKMWELLKIPIAPATLIGGAIQTAVQLGALQKEVGYVALIADIAWASYKITRGVLDRSLAVAGREAAVTQIKAFLHTQSERAAFMHQTIIESHDPELRQSLSDSEKY